MGATVTYSQACSVVSAMIMDAKKDMVNLHRVSESRRLTSTEEKKFYDAKSWLCNGNGGLESLLSGIGGLSLPDSLEQLRKFATVDYKKFEFMEGESA